MRAKLVKIKIGGVSMRYTRQQFIEEVGPMAKTDSQQSKVLASVTIAQAILESDNGNSRLASEGKALFGIKANTGWQGKIWTGTTLEYYDGKRKQIVAGFRAYNSWEASIKDHSNFLIKNKRYQAIIGEKDYRAACKALQTAGYATDPNYASKLIQLIETYQLTRYDGVVTGTEKDEPLFKAVQTIIQSGISIDFNSWKRMNLIKLSNVPSLIVKLGGLDQLVKKGIISDRTLWETEKYEVQHVRSLLIKYALLIGQKKPFQ